MTEIINFDSDDKYLHTSLTVDNYQNNPFFFFFLIILFYSFFWA